MLTVNCILGAVKYDLREKMRHRSNFCSTFPIISLVTVQECMIGPIVPCSQVLPTDMFVDVFSSKWEIGETDYVGVIAQKPYRYELLTAWASTSLGKGLMCKSNLFISTLCCCLTLHWGLARLFRNCLLFLQLRAFRSVPVLRILVLIVIYCDL